MGQGSSSSDAAPMDDNAQPPEGQQQQRRKQPPAQSPPPFEPQKDVPAFIGGSSQLRILSDDLAATLLAALPAAYQSCGKKVQWLQLYNSNTNGKSFHRLVQNITEKGPTIIVIQIKNSSRVIGAFCDAEWFTTAVREKQAVSNAAARQRAAREGQSGGNVQRKPDNQNNIFFGAEPCFVFCAGGEGPDKVSPAGQVYNSRSFANSNFMYLFDTHPQEEKVGIGMGGQPGYFGWFIDRWLERGECKGAKCTTFQNPRLSETESWEVGTVEAYAVKPDVVQRILAEQGSDPAGGGQSVLRKKPDMEADKMLLELHGVHQFDMNQRPDC